MDLNSMIIGVFYLALFFAAMLLFLCLGNRIARFQLKNYPSEKHASVKIVEGAIFALMGLLIAFTFSNTHERFNLRKSLVIEEANSIKTAYLRLDLLPTGSKIEIQHEIKQYLLTRISLYKKLPNLDAAYNDLKQTEFYQNKIWNDSVKSTIAANNVAAAIILLPALNKMIDVANTRTLASQIHPPIIIYIILTVLALLSAVVSGYGMGSKKIWRSISVFVYCAVIAFTIFVIIDMEYPQIGFIQTTYFESILPELSKSLH